jgi:hypothetical protein
MKEPKRIERKRMEIRQEIWKKNMENEGKKKKGAG